jgi:RNA-directed DNA polymerase
MTRLGFWPPSDDVAAQAKEAEEQLSVLYKELARLKGDLAQVETEIGAAEDIPYLLQEIRRKRIERVRTERAKKKEERKAEKAAKQAATKEWREKTVPFLGRGVSAGLTYEGGASEKAEALGLPALSSATDVAQAIGITERELAWLAYHRDAAGSDHYTRFTIPKKRKGGVRVISSPKKRLRVAQGWMLVSLLEKLPIHDAAMAFRPGRSVVDNAARHEGKAVIIRIDLKDFFPSIGVNRVKKLFQSLGYNEGVSSVMALLATETPRIAVTLDGQKRFAAIGPRALPQGACTSPAITNLLCRRLDGRLTGLAEKAGFTYTRYADDLIFSHADPDARIGLFLAMVRRILEHEGLIINEDKTAILRPHQRQTVTGLVVNSVRDGEKGDGPRVSRRDLRKFRAFLHHCDTDGVEAVSQKLGQDALAYASGYLSFIHMSAPEKAQQIAAAHPWISRWKAAAE